MGLASTITGAVGDLLVLIALIVTVKALNTANGARSEAVAADKTASKARLEAANREIESVHLASESLEQARTATREASQREREATERGEAAAAAAAAQIAGGGSICAVAFSLPSRGKAVDEGRLRTSVGLFGSSTVGSVRCGCCTLLLHPVGLLTI
jgi:hypothetical protein